MRRRQKNVVVYMLLAIVVIVILVIALASGGGGAKISKSPTPSTTEFFSPGVEGNLSPVQQVAFQRLSAESRLPPSVRVEHGIVRFSFMQVPASGSTQVDRAVAFLGEYSDLYDLADPTQNLHLEEAESDTQGAAQVSFSQSIHGIPVYGALIQVHLNSAGEVTTVQGGYIPSQVPAIQPAVSAEDANGLWIKNWV
jgi:hypothetical protein